MKRILMAGQKAGDTAVAGQRIFAFVLRMARRAAMGIASLWCLYALAGAASPTAAAPDGRLQGQSLAVSTPTATPGPSEATLLSGTAQATIAATVSPTKAGYTTYTVRAGDTLTRIAAWFGTTPANLIALNHLTNPNALAVDQVLIVPLPPTATITLTPSLTLTPTDTPLPGATLPRPADTAAPTATPAPTETPVPTATPSLTATATVTATVTPTEAPSLTPSATATNSPLPPTETSAPSATPTLTPTETLTPGPTVTPIPSNFAVGVSSLTGSESAFMAAQDLGVGWLRLDVDWKTIEATRGQRDFGRLDAAVLRANGAGIKLLLTVTNAPFWARNGVNEDGPPVENATFDAFLKDLATRYAGKVSAYEIWNEPNLRRNWNGQPLSAESYVKLLRGAYGVIKAADPAALVISAGLSPTGYSDGKNAIGDREYLAAAYKAGLAQVSDGIGAHPFGWGNPPDSTCCKAAPGVSGWYDSRTFFFLNTLADYHQIMVEAGDGSTPLWLTALGWGTADGVAAPVTVRAASFGFVTFLDQQQQAAYLERALALSKLAGYVGPTFVYNLDGCQAAPPDAGASSFYWCYYALLNADGKARPAYDTLKNWPK